MIQPFKTAELWFKKRTELEQAAEVKRILRRVFFRDQDSVIALAVLLDDMYWNREATTPEAVALRNYATTFLVHRLGIAGDTAALMTAIINSVQKEK